MKWASDNILGLTAFLCTIGENGGIDLYGFVRNRPVNVVDADGLLEFPRIPTIPRFTSWAGGIAKEIEDSWRKHFGDGGGDGFDFGDLDANREGRNRGRHCKGKSCEEACKGM